MEQYLTFQLAEVNYGIQIMEVREIRSFEKPTKMVTSNASVKGVLDLRGEIVPILSLRDKFNLSPIDDMSSIVIIISINEQSIGIMVDSVSDVTDIIESEIHSPEKVINLDYVKGLYTDKNGKLLILLNTADFIGLDELAVIE